MQKYVMGGCQCAILQGAKVQGGTLETSQGKQQCEMLQRAIAHGEIGGDIVGESNVRCCVGQRC